MQQLILLFVFLITQFSVFSQTERNISWIENNLREHVIIEGQEKSFSIDERMKMLHVPGASIAIIKDGEIVFAKGYGIANESTGTMVNTHTLFQAGSISKPIASLAVLKLVQDGKLDLDEDVNSYLKNWKLPETEFTKTEKVTLRRILNHTAGLNAHGFPGYSAGDDIPTTIEILNGEGNTKKIESIKVPGESWKYSGGGYTIMQQVVNDVTGMSLIEYMEKYILPEIGMTESTFKYDLDDSTKAKVSAAYRENGKIYKGEWLSYPETAAAGLWTTPTDLAKYCRYMQQLNSKEIDGIFSKDIIDQVFSPGLNNWGLGLSLSGEGDSLCFEHSGKNAGFTNDFKAFTNSGDGIIVMTNGDNGFDLIRDIFRAVSTFYDWNFNKYIYAKPIELSKAELTPFTGEYELPMGQKIALIVAKVKKSKVVLSSKQLPGKVVLTAISENEFIDLNTGMRVNFMSDEAQKVTHFILNEQMKATRK